MKFLNINNNVSFKQMPDGGVEYTGDSIPSLGINKGDGLDKVLGAVLSEVAALRVLEDGSPINMVVQGLVDNMDNISIDNLKTSAATFDLGSVSSVASSRISNKNFNWEGSVVNDKYHISYDMSETTSSLPEDYTVLGGSLRVQGTSTTSTLIGSSSGTVSSIKIPSTAVPVNLNFSLRVKTPEGDLELARTVSIQNLQEVSTSGTLGLRDFTSPTHSNLTQKEYNEIVTSELSTLRQEVKELKALKLQTLQSRVAALESNSENT